MTVSFPGYPVEETFADLRLSLLQGNKVVLEAPPGAGKTTLVPLLLMGEGWLEGRKIIMLEPRRLAARMAAQRMADLLGEKVGETVGYRIRQERKISSRTRIEVVTEGILTRQIQNDPELDGVGVVIFDEFHERNLQGDLGLALCLESQEALRDDLRLLVMSATLDGQGISDFLGQAPRITSHGRSYNVETRHLPRPADLFSLPEAASRAVRQAVREESGSLLVFLPGEGEIRKVQALLDQHFAHDTNILIAPLYGALPAAQQQAAIRPCAQGARKIVLATTIAETSLTIEGIRVVVDCGFKRVSRFDPARAMSRLETVRISKASAEQRKGRAGRLEAGVCYRLWPQAETQALAEREEAEILHSDLAPFALELAAWGVKSPSDLRLLDQPAHRAFALAQDLLVKLGALSQDFNLTDHGRQVMALGMHPRIAHMVLQACENAPEDAVLACDIAAILNDGPLFKGRRECDLRDSLSLFHGENAKGQIAKGALHRARQTSKELQKRLGVGKNRVAGVLETGRLLALAYPDRIAKRRSSDQPDYLLSAGMGVRLPEHDSLMGEEYLVVAHMDASKAQGRIFSAAPLSLQEIETDFADLIEEIDEIGWDKRTQAVKAERVRKLGAIALQVKPLASVSAEQRCLALCYGIRQMGIGVLPWTADCEALCQRLECLRELDDSWPAGDADSLLNDLENWLMPFLNGCSRIEHLKKVDLQTALLSRMDWGQQQRLAELAPTHYCVPSGSYVRLDYSNPLKPVLSVKLQEMFGEPQTPTINQGRISLQIHLLSPAGRPLQVTEDLASFWKNGYDSVKKEMRGRYPKHPWPDDPTQAIATRKTKRNLA